MMEQRIGYLAKIQNNVKNVTSSQPSRSESIPELEHRIKKVSERLSENMHIIANEPSLAFYRIQEHVRKSLPQLVKKKHEIQDVQEKIKGGCFDAEYAINAIKDMESSKKHFKGIQDLLKNSMFLNQQLNYEKNRRENQKVKPSMYRSMTRTNTVDLPVSSNSDVFNSLTSGIQISSTPDLTVIPRMRVRSSQTVARPVSDVPSQSSLMKIKETTTDE